MIYAYGSTDDGGVGFHDELDFFHKDFGTAARKIINYHGLNYGKVEIELKRDSASKGFVFLSVFTSIILAIEVLIL
jgi:hypothetical protein